MTNEPAEKLFKEFGKRKLKCPFCKNKGWFVQEDNTFIFISTDPDSTNPFSVNENNNSFSTTTVMKLTANCKKCGYTMFFSKGLYEEIPEPNKIVIKKKSVDERIMHLCVKISILEGIVSKLSAPKHDPNDSITNTKYKVGDTNA